MRFFAAIFNYFCFALSASLWDIYIFIQTIFFLWEISLAPLNFWAAYLKFLKYPVSIFPLPTISSITLFMSDSNFSCDVITFLWSIFIFVGQFSLLIPILVPCHLGLQRDKEATCKQNFLLVGKVNDKCAESNNQQTWKEVARDFSDHGVYSLFSWRFVNWRPRSHICTLHK